MIRLALALVVLALPACATPAERDDPCRCPDPKSIAVPQVSATPAITPATFAALPNWASDDHAAALEAFRRGCAAIRDARWRGPCDRAQALGKTNSSGNLSGVARAEARRFFESEFIPHSVAGENNAETGLVTGYYEPLLRGSRARSGSYQHAILGVPDDLVAVDLGSVVTDSRALRLRGRLDGRRLVPYYSRAEIDAGRVRTTSRELFYVDDPIELFFLQVQGSGRIRLPDNVIVRIGYGDQNGHPYRSIGAYLVERGEMTLDEASMQSIKRWAQANPQRLNELLHHNPSFVFFREVPAGDIPDGLGARGAMGVPLTPERSVAVDTRFIPLGAPVYLATTRPNSDVALERLVLAQDTGGAIRGANRIDFYWGFGAQPGEEAGRMRQRGRVWVLLPRS